MIVLVVFSTTTSTTNTTSEWLCNTIPVVAVAVVVQYNKFISSYVIILAKNKHKKHTEWVTRLVSQISKQFFLDSI